MDFCGRQLSESAGLIEGKKIRALAVVNATRLPSLPDVPTAREAGFPELDVVGWQGLSGPPKLPPAVVQKQATKQSKVIAYKGPEAFWQFQQDELKKYVPLATKMGIRK